MATATERKGERSAAAIVLVRGRGPDLRVYLVERARELRFFGGYHAFPGGVRDKVDGEDGADGDVDALRRCALRELLEETGVLAERGLAPTPAERAAARAELLTRGAEPRLWAALLARSPASGRSLRVVCRVRTPPFAPLRYDTVFFLADATQGEEPEVVRGELVDGRWWRPADALAAWREGRVAIVPPALLLLELLAAGDVDAFCADAAALAQSYREGALHQVRFSPGIVLAPLRTPTLPPATTTNCLIVGTEELWIVDPASSEEGEQQRLVALCDELCRGGRARVAGVLATHHHPDHVGGLAAAARHFGVLVRAHEVTLPRLPRDCPLGAPLADGDRILLGTAPDGGDGWFLEALFTPGHDRGHLCFRESRYGALIAGDMVSTVSTIVIDPPEGHLRTYLQSLARLRDLELGTLYPAHGPAVLDGRRPIEAYLQHRAAREAALCAALARGPATVEELVPVVYADTDRALHVVAARSLRAGLDKLEEDRVASRDGERWRLLRA